MLKKTVLHIAAAALLVGVAPIQTATGDDMWDMMDPSWWYDEFFDDDDDKWWRRYRYHPYNPYWGGGPYGMYPPPQEPLIIQIQPETPDPESEMERPQ